MLGVESVQCHLLPQLAAVAAILSDARKHLALSACVNKCEHMLLLVLGYFVKGRLMSIDFPLNKFASMSDLLAMRVTTDRVKREVTHGGNRDDHNDQQQQQQQLKQANKK